MIKGEKLMAPSTLQSSLYVMEYHVPKTLQVLPILHQSEFLHKWLRHVNKNGLLNMVLNEISPVLLKLSHNDA